MPGFRFEPRGLSESEHIINPYIASACITTRDYGLMLLFVIIMLIVIGVICTRLEKIERLIIYESDMRRRGHP